MVLFRVVLPVADFTAAVAWSGAALSQAGRRAARGRRHFDCGGVILAVLDPRLGGDARPNQEPLHFAVGDLEAVYARLTAALGAGGRADGAIAVRAWGERSFYATDPWGNRLCLVAAGTEFTADRTVDGG